MNLLLWDPSFLHAEEQTDGQTDRTKLIFPFSNFTKAPETNRDYFPEYYYNLIFIKDAKYDLCYVEQEFLNIYTNLKLAYVKNF